MLVTADIAKGDPGNASIRYPLEVERPAAPAEDLDGLAASSDQQNRAFRDENLVLVDPRPVEDLIVRTCVFDGGAGPSIGGGIGRVHYQRVAAGRVGRGILPQRLGIRRKVLLDVDPIGLQLVRAAASPVDRRRAAGLPRPPARRCSPQTAAAAATSWRTPAARVA